MKFDLYSTIMLSRSLPEFGFKKGDVATIVDIIESDKGNGYILEFFDAQGETISVIPVMESNISKPYEHAVVNYRKLAIPA